MCHKEFSIEEAVHQSLSAVARAALLSSWQMVKNITRSSRCGVRLLLLVLKAQPILLVNHIGRPLLAPASACAMADFGGARSTRRFVRSTIQSQEVLAPSLMAEQCTHRRSINWCTKR
jgi:hypothetical protein